MNIQSTKETLLQQLPLLRRLLKKTSLINEDYIRRIYRKECWIRSDDTIIGSYPRSGRTWVRFFLGAYINHLYKLGLEVNWNNFAMLSPGYLCNERDGLLLFPKGIPRMIFSHNRPIGRYFPNRNVVFITRNFCNIMISVYYFQKHRQKKHLSKLDLREFITHEFDFDDAISRINYFSQQLEIAQDVLIMPYESMRKSPETWFKKLVLFSNYKFEEDAFERALKFSSFSSMKKMEQRQMRYESDEQYHTRKGEIDKPSSYLDEETIVFIENILENNLKGMLKEYYI